MKIKFNSDDELPLNKTIEIPSMIIVFEAVFYGNKEQYPQVFWNEYLYDICLKRAWYLSILVFFKLKV